MTDILEKLGIVQHKTFKLHSAVEADGTFIPEIVALLEKIDALSAHAADSGTLWKYANLVLRYTLEWLCLRNTRCSAFDIPLIPKYTHAQLVALLLRYDTHLILTWFTDLNNWCEKFTTGQRPAAHDLPLFKVFMLQFLHNLQKRSCLLEFLLEDLPLPINTPLPNLPTVIKPELTSVGGVDLAPINPQNDLEGDACPICQSPFQTNRHAIKWCLACNYYRDHLFLGYSLDNLQHDSYLIKIKEMVKNMLIFGGVGEGKSSTVHRLTHEAREHQIVTWVIACDKQDHRKLIHDQLRNPQAQNGWWVFTVKDRLVNFLCLNPLIPPPGVPLETHLDNFTLHFSHWFGLQRWAAGWFRQSTFRLFESMGWDISLNTFTPDPAHPLYPLPLDLIKAVEDTVRGQYSADTEKDVGGHLLHRVRQFNSLSLGLMWNTPQSISWDELLSHNIVFELQSLDAETKQFFVSMMLVLLFEYLQVLGEYTGVRLLIVIEEASSLFSKSTVGDDGQIINTSDQIIEKFFSLGRAYGVSLVLVDQTPDQMPSRALTLANTVIIHNLKSEKSHAILKPHCPKLEFIPSLRVGEAVITGKDEQSHEWTVHHIKIAKLPHLPASVSNTTLKEYMAPFYTAYPGFQTPDPAIAKRVRQLLSTPPTTAPSAPHSPLLVGLTTDDIDPAQALHPLQTDLNCAAIETDIFGPQCAIGAAPPESLKSLVRTRLEDPTLQARLQNLQAHLIRFENVPDQLEPIVQDTFQQILTWVRPLCPPAALLPALRFTLRLLIFKYLRLGSDQRLALFMTFTELLVQYISPSEVNSNEIGR